MISGAVNLMRQPVITLTVRDGSGQHRAAEARVDTGFSGDLTLPKSAIEQLGLRWIYRTNSYKVGDGSTSPFNAYAAIIQWRGDDRYITVLESEIFPVLGVGLLWESSLSVDFVPGGDVTIKELPEG